MSKSAPPAPSIFAYADIEWDRPLETAAPGKAPPAELVAEAERSGARRKKVVRGAGGFFMNRSVLPPGFRIPAHQHSHSELLIVLRGGCTIDGGLAQLGPDDSIVIHADTRYGFTCGPDGMEFITVRTGEATTE
jgi:quercetin dioxygenase-like cupin family protein